MIWVSLNTRFQHSFDKAQKLTSQPMAILSLVSDILTWVNQLLAFFRVCIDGSNEDRESVPSSRVRVAKSRLQTFLPAMEGHCVAFIGGTGYSFGKPAGDFWGVNRFFLRPFSLID